MGGEVWHYNNPFFRTFLLSFATGSGVDGDFLYPVLSDLLILTGTQESFGSLLHSQVNQIWTSILVSWDCHLMPVSTDQKAECVNQSG